MRDIAFVLIAVGLSACGGGNPSIPSPPTAVSSVVIAGATPAAGSTIVVPERYPYVLPGGVVIPPGSGLISVKLSLTSAHDVPWARLNVYLLTGGTTSEYCGENGPDAPTWSFLTPGWTTTYTVTGFRVYRLPCEVTGIRAMLHMRNNGLIAPPLPSETVADATVARNILIRREGS
jgi:hypothetical protein